MSLQMQISTHPEHLEVSVSGSFDLENAVGLLQEVMVTAKDANRQNVLIDLRGMDGTPTTIESYNYGKFVADQLRDIRFGKVGQNLKLAYVAEFPMAKFAEDVARNRGAVAFLSKDYGEALEWLTGNAAS